MRSRMFLIVACAFLFVIAVGLVRAEEKAAPGAPAKKDAAAEGKTPARPAADAKSAEGAIGAKSAEAAAEPATKAGAKKPAAPALALSVDAIQELEERKIALDTREKQLNERAHDLEIQEKLLREKLKKMEDLNQKMAERLDGFKADHDGRIAKLVTVVEGMKPDAAARYVEALEPELAVEILARIKEAKASKILNLVDKKLGARLTELYTGYRDSVDEPAAAPVPTSNAKEAPAANKPM